MFGIKHRSPECQSSSFMTEFQKEDNKLQLRHWLSTEQIQVLIHLKIQMRERTGTELWTPSCHNLKTWECELSLTYQGLHANSHLNYRWICIMQIRIWRFCAVSQELTERFDKYGSNMLNSALHHHPNTSRDSASHEHWSCSASWWWNNTFLTHLMLVQLLYFSVVNVGQYRPELL